MSHPRIGPVLRQFGTTDEEVEELTARLGPLDMMGSSDFIMAIALLKIQNLEKRIAELEKKDEKQD